MLCRPLLPSALVVLAAACTTANEPSGHTAEPPLEPMGVAAACTSLLLGMPSEWPERMAPVFAAGAAATPVLVAGLREQPGSPGAEAAVALLGRLAGPDAQPYLDEQIVDRSALAVAAALVIGELRAAASLPTLRACAADQFADATLRTAAACALVRCGDRISALPVLRAVLLAGTPAGAALEREVGLPAKTRWALERYFVQRLLQQEGQIVLADALDTDAPWAELDAVTTRIVAWLESR